MHLRGATLHDLPAASDLCLRSKAHWGYDLAFLEACREELIVTPQDLSEDQLILSVQDDQITGLAQVSCDQESCILERLFIDPNHMGQGIGRRLFDWSVTVARYQGASELIVESDPQAEGFYRRMGCQPAGTAPSGSIPGRVLPRLTLAISGAQD
ncbi:MAG: GNAT family N-acetyltransferase [Pseudomonadota bacterium]